MKSLHPVSENPPPERTKAFWVHVRFFIETIWALFGGPETIAELRNLARDEHKLLASWLRKAEALVRKLLVIEAADVALVETKKKKRAAAKREKKLREFYPDEPHLWRVAFRISESISTASERRLPCQREKWEAKFPDARPLAERFEALLRVFDAPETYVKRAARLMRRKPQNIDTLTRTPVFEGYEDIFEPLRPLLDDVRFKPSDTS